LTVYHRQPPNPGPNSIHHLAAVVFPPLHRRTLQRSHSWSRRGNIPNIIRPARSFSSPWPLGSSLPLATPPCAQIVETRQIHFALVRARSHVFVEGLGRPITSCPRCVEWRCCHHHHHLGVPVVVPGSFWPLSVKAVCMCANPSGYTAPPAAASTPGSKKKSRKKKTNGSNNTLSTAAANEPEPAAVDASGNDGAGSPEDEDEVDETLDSVCIPTHTSHESSRAAWFPASPDQC
jgi:hypothetical protein